MKNSHAFRLWANPWVRPRILCLSLITYLSSLISGGAQNVAINTTGASADPSALLDVKSTTAGVLIPRMSTSQRNAISSPAIGLQIFNTDCNVLNYWTGTCWVSAGAIPAPDSISSSVSTILCAGATATYTIPAITGATSYYWSAPPGANITSGQGTTSVNVTYNNVSGNVCVTANDACETSQPTCRAIQINSSPVSVSIAANPAGTVGPGTNVTFTATPVNGGPAPAYQWKNGSVNVGTNSPTYTSTFTNGNVITCVMTTSSTNCVTGSPATSNAITMSVTSPVTLNISTSTYNGRQVFTYAGGNQTFNVPSYVTQIFVKMWGAGGGGGSASCSEGGSGAFVSGYLSVTPSSTLTIVVGGSGIYTPIINTSAPGGFGGGGAAGTGSTSTTGSGGGRSAIQIVAGKDTATAGGGGGGGSYDYSCGVEVTYGGGGGATGGENGYNCYTGTTSAAYGSGQGGTTTTGGAATIYSGAVNSVAASSLRYTYSGSAGGGPVAYAGGGGGGGFFGGSGGAGYSSNGNVPIGGGGGGSSYLGSLTSSINGSGKQGNSSPNAVINPTDVDYITGVGVGGSEDANGGNGLVVIYW